MFLILLLCSLCNASLLHLRDTILQQQEEDAVDQLKAKVLDKGVCIAFCIKGTQCNPSTGQCEPVSCDASNACPSNKFCQSVIRSCPAGAFCPQFVCVNPRCEGEGNFCGGVASFPCPQGSTCVDDPQDDCDPLKGGVNCEGRCQCNVKRQPSSQPTSESPSLSLPDVLTPSVVAPTVFAPSVVAPTVFAPTVFAPTVFAPTAYAPTVYTPTVPSTNIYGTATVSRVELLQTSTLSLPTSYPNSILPQNPPGSDAADVLAVPSRDRSGSESQDTIPASFLAQPPLPPAAVCCDLATKPGRRNNPACPFSVVCCLSGTWVCTKADGSFTCDGTNYTPADLPVGAQCPLDCSNVQCPTLPCPRWQQYQQPDECCLTCKRCANGLVPSSSQCSSQAPCGTGYKCEAYVLSQPGGSYNTVGLCCKDCSGIFCFTPNCPEWQRYVPAGGCCARCRTCPSGNLALTTTDCAQTRGVCPGDYTCSGFIDISPWGERTSHGLCCAPDCTKMTCPILNCPISQQFTPAYACCKYCKQSTCPNGSAPLPGNCPTTACPIGSYCQGYVITPVPGGPHYSYGLCCSNL